MQTATLYRYRWKLIRIGLIIGLFAVAQLSRGLAQSVPAAAAPSGPRLFTQQCAACHSMTAGETRVGPSLAGIAGKTAGKQPGFAYSPALKRSGMKWNAVTLDRWLSDTNAAIPGSVMNYKQADAAKRKALVTYLTTGK
jgi:cytochrome c